MATTITAGDLSNPAIISSDTTGAVVIQTGAAGAKVNALTISAAGGVACNVHPCFRAWNSSITSLPASTYTKIGLQSENFDITNAFDSVTNYRFQPAIAGYYQINGAISIASSQTGYAGIRKNGSIDTYGQYSNGFSFVVSDLVYLNGSTDYVELWGFQNSGVAVNTTPGVGSTYFSGALVRAA